MILLKENLELPKEVWKESMRGFTKKVRKRADDFHKGWRRHRQSVSRQGMPAEERMIDGQA